ncbi:hypothetical protein DFJ73DRAFT_914353 [Zopfochytrium polystomum]|nr:hypothetical protein DFJ73DRAFT_914353 [Zopfochytrium polystomum]
MQELQAHTARLPPTHRGWEGPLRGSQSARKSARASDRSRKHHPYARPPAPHTSPAQGRAAAGRRRRGEWVDCGCRSCSSSSSSSIGGGGVEAGWAVVPRGWSGSGARSAVTAAAEAWAAGVAWSGVVVSAGGLFGGGGAGFVGGGDASEYEGSEVGDVSEDQVEEGLRRRVHEGGGHLDVERCFGPRGFPVVDGAAYDFGNGGPDFTGILPQEVLENIFITMSPFDLTVAGGVSQRWRMFARHPAVWKEVCRKYWCDKFYHPLELHPLMDWGPLAHTLTTAEVLTILARRGVVIFLGQKPFSASWPSASFPGFSIWTSQDSDRRSLSTDISAALSMREGIASSRRDLALSGSAAGSGAGAGEGEEETDSEELQDEEDGNNEDDDQVGGASVLSPLGGTDEPADGGQSTVRAGQSRTSSAVAGDDAFTRALAQQHLEETVASLHRSGAIEIRLPPPPPQSDGDSHAAAVPHYPLAYQPLSVSLRTIHAGPTPSSSSTGRLATPPPSRPPTPTPGGNRPQQPQPHALQQAHGVAEAAASLATSASRAWLGRLLLATTPSHSPFGRRSAGVAGLDSGGNNVGGGVLCADSFRGCGKWMASYVTAWRDSTRVRITRVELVELVWIGWRRDQPDVLGVAQFKENGLWESELWERREWWRLRPDGLPQVNFYRPLLVTRTREWGFMLSNDKFVLFSQPGPPPVCLGPNYFS